MKNFNEYVNATPVDESIILSNALKKVGILVLTSVIPFLISLGVKIASLRLDVWVDKLAKKYPQHREAINMLSEIMKNNINSLDKCKSFITNTENQKPSGYLSIEEIKEEILPLISNENDKKKVEDFLNMIDSEKFKEEIDQ